MQRLLQLFVVTLLAFSCTDKVTFVERPSAEPAAVIRGVIYDGLPLYAYVVKAVPELTGTIDYRLQGATVELFKDDSLMVQLTEVTEDDGIVQVAGRVRTWYKTLDPIYLQPGSSYFLRVTAAGVPTAQSASLFFDPVLQIDSITNLKSVIDSDDNTLAEVADIKAHMSISREAEGSLTALYETFRGDVIPDTVNLRGIGFAYDLFPGSEFTILLDPTPGRKTLNLEYLNDRGGSDASRYPLFLMEFTFLPKDYIDFYRQAINGGRFQDFNGLNSRIGPISTNIENGYGFFTLAERYRLWIPLPE